MEKTKTKCSICQNNTSKYERLACDHKFCTECVSHQISRLSSIREHDTVTIVCPYCRDFFLSKVAFLKTTQKKPPKLKRAESAPARRNPEFSAEVAKRCQPCAEMKEYSKSSFWCHNCMEFLCSTCANYHKIMKLFKHHIVKTLKDKERYGDIKSKIYDDPKFQTPTTRVSKSMEQTRYKCEPCGESRKIQDAVYLCQNCNEKMCNACCRCHGSMKMSKSHKIIQLIELVSKPEESIESKCSRHYGELLSLYCKRCKTSCCHICVITLHSNCGSTKALQSKQPGEIKKQIDAPKPVKGNLKTHFKDESNDKTVSKKAPVLKFPKYKMESRKARINFGGNTKGDWVISMALLASGDILLTELLQPTLKMIDSSGNLLSLCSFYGDPWSVAVYNDSLAAITFSDRKQIQLINVDNYKGLEAGKRINTRHKGLAICFAKDLIVTSCWNGGCIHLMNIKGTELCSIDRDNYGDTLFTNPEYITSNKLGTSIYITDYKRDTVTALKLLPTRIDNKPEFVFKNADLQGPKGIAVDRQGVIFVAGMTSRNIFRLSPAGDIIQNFRRREDTDYYEAIAVSSTADKVLVSAFEDNTIIVMKLLT